MRSAAVLISITLALPGGLLGQAPRARTFPKFGLTLTLPELENLDSSSNGDRIHVWSGQLGRSTVTIRLDFLPKRSYRLKEPADVLVGIAYDRQHRKSDFGFAERSHRKGPYGFVPYASLAQAEERPAGGSQASGQDFFLGGILEKDGYSIEITCRPPLSQDSVALILDFLKEGIRYEGEIRDARWTKERIEERWKSAASTRLQGDLKVIRTKHYIVMTNSSSARLFAKKMEELYRRVRKIYPFEEVEGQELLPVLLFRLPGEYYDFFMKECGQPRAAAEATKGFAGEDYYATWYSSPKDQVHSHEATHQIFSNRLHLLGGGSWFQEGMAEYICTKKNERNHARRQVRRGSYTPLKTFMKLESLLGSSGSRTVKGRDPARDNYLQAALLTEFLRESEWGRSKFQEFVHTIGQLPDNDLAAIESALRKLYGVDIEGLEKAFQRYCGG